jgi:hypothetical protein
MCQRIATANRLLTSRRQSYIVAASVRPAGSLAEFPSQIRNARITLFLKILQKQRARWCGGKSLPFLTTIPVKLTPCATAVMVARDVVAWVLSP